MCQVGEGGEEEDVLFLGGGEVHFCVVNGMGLDGFWYILWVFVLSSLDGTRYFGSIVLVFEIVLIVLVFEIENECMKEET